jgi:exonuclease SbcC
MKLRLKDFRCYEDATFDFGKNGMTLLTGQSGVGKSSIMMAINYVLFGQGNKLKRKTTGKCNCQVELEFEDIKIVRYSSPRRLIVNNIYEDDVAQDIINKKFGNTFSVIGYIAQNAINSFMIMSPTEKLEFLETFAFKDIDLNAKKNKCKMLITERNEKLITIRSKLITYEELLSKEEKPEKVEFPIKCIKKNQERVCKNEEIKLINATKLIKKHKKNIDVLKLELDSLIIYNTTLINKKDILDNIKNKIKLLENKLIELGDYNIDEHNKYKKLLNIILSRKEIENLEKNYNDNLKKVEIMKQNEIDTLIIDINNIKTTLWKENNEIECKDILKDNEIYLKDLEEIENINNKLEKYNKINKEELTTNKNKVNELKYELDVNKNLLNNIKIQKELYNCPICKTHLRIKNNELYVIELNDKIDDNIIKNENEIENKIIILNNNIQKLEYVILDIETKLSHKNILINDLNLLKNKYNELSDIKDVKEDIEYIKNYYTEQIQLSKKLTKLEYNLKNNIYSNTYENFKNNLNIDKEYIKKIKYELNEFYDYLDENIDTIYNIDDNELRNKINEYDVKIYKIKDINNELEIYRNEENKYNNQLINLYNNHINIFNEIKDEKDIKDLINKEEIIINELEIRIKEYQNNLTKIENYNKYIKELNKYEELEKEVIRLKEEERKEQYNYAAAIQLKEKILDAESICMKNIINIINDHAQLYLDTFFQNEPIVVRLSTFKENKKNIKPQINIEIEYKGIDSDLTMLSGGEFSRVMLAYTLALTEIFNTPLLLLDECTASLDQELTNVVFESIKENFNGKKVIIIAHQVVTGIFDNIINITDKNKKKLIK